MEPRPSISTDPQSKITPDTWIYHSQVGNRGCKLGTVLFSSPCSDLHRVCKIGNFHLTSAFFTIFISWHHWQHWAYIQHGSNCPEEAEPPPGPDSTPGHWINVTRLAPEASEWEPVHHLSLPQVREGNPEIIWQGPSVSLAGAVTPPQ